MKNPHDVIIKPVMTEKSYEGISARRYTFLVDTHASKPEIRQAVEEVFGVKVLSVNTLNSEGKMKRQGAHKGRRASTKKAFVTLRKDSKGIEFFDSMSQ